MLQFSHLWNGDNTLVNISKVLRLLPGTYSVLFKCYLLLLLMLFWLLLLNGPKPPGQVAWHIRKTSFFVVCHVFRHPAIETKDHHRVLKFRCGTPSFKTFFPQTSPSGSRLWYARVRWAIVGKDKTLCLELCKCSGERASRLLTHTHWQPSQVRADCSEFSTWRSSAPCVAN